MATGRPSGADYEWERFKKTKIDSFVDVIITASEVKKRKPAPDSIVERGRKMDIHPKNCLVVGDSVSDILATREAGAISIAVSTGIDDSVKLKNQRPEDVLDRLDHVIGLFEIG